MMDKDFDLGSYLDSLPEPEPVDTLEEYHQRKKWMQEKIYDGIVDPEMGRRVIRDMLAELKAHTRQGYRVICRAGTYAVHEVYADKEGRAWFFQDEPVRLEAKTLEELHEKMHQYFSSIDLPVVEGVDAIPDS